MPEQAPDHIFGKREAIIGTLEGLALVGFTTVYAHRELHQSLELQPATKAVARVGMWLGGNVPRIWKAVHLQHHAMSDANFVPMIELADYLEWRVAHPEVTKPPIPELFNEGSLDPAAELTPNQIRTIGSLARQTVQGRYLPPASYDSNHARDLLDPVTPRYFYYEPTIIDSVRRKLTGQKPEPLHPDSIHNLSHELRDPHSPALARKGGSEVLVRNVPFYRSSAKAKNAEKQPEKLITAKTN